MADQKEHSPKNLQHFIDDCCNAAIKNGAPRGKFTGFGSGGFFMFYCGDNQMKLKLALKDKGLHQMRFHFDFEGVKTLVDMMSNKLDNPLS